MRDNNEDGEYLHQECYATNELGYPIKHIERIGFNPYWVPLHQFIMEEKEGLNYRFHRENEKGQGHITVHHKDFNKWNNNPENLERMTRKAHIKLHASLIGKGKSHPNFGRRFSKEWCEKISESNKGKLRSEKTKQKMSLASKGRVVSDKTRKKISKTLTGKPLSEKTKEKLSLAHQGKNHFMFGKHLQNDVKKKISLALIGKHPSEETRKKLKNRKITDETRKKLSEIHKARWAKIRTTKDTGGFDANGNPK